jgi:hypothetical protein
VRRSYPVLLTVALLVPVFATPAMVRPAGAAGSPYETVEAETMAISPGAGAVVSDSGASGGSAIGLTRNGTVGRYVQTAGGAKVTVFARGDQCLGSPPDAVRMSVFANGVKVADKIPVPGTTYAPYQVTVPGGLAAGNRWIGLTFDNDFVQAGVCDRNLFVDRVVIQTSAAINTGLAGSACLPSDNGNRWTNDPSVSTTYLGAAPSYYEVGAPTGTNAGKPPKGVMILIHGGGWYYAGPAGVVANRANANFWRAWGFSTVSVTYRGCTAGMLDDIAWFYDRIQSWFPGTRTCATGGSAGGHLTLMLAASRPLSCAISLAGPTDLADPSGSSSTVANIHDFGVAAFGAEALQGLSPRYQVASISAPVLQAVLQNDAFREIPGQVSVMDDLLRTAHPEGRYEEHQLPPPAPGALVCGTPGASTNPDLCMRPFVHGATTGTAWTNVMWAQALFALA